MGAFLQIVILCLYFFVVSGQANRTVHMADNESRLNGSKYEHEGFTRDTAYSVSERYIEEYEYEDLYRDVANSKSELNGTEYEYKSMYRDTPLSDSERTDYIYDGEEAETEDIYWKPDAVSAEAFQGTVCPTRCNGTEKVNFPSSFRCLQCFPCSCASSCAKEGTCCPLDGHQWSPPPVERVQCKPNVGSENILHVVACDPDFPSSETRTLCQSKSLPRRRDTILPVTSTVSGVTYANKYCAMCNRDAESVVEWNTTCLHNQYLYNATNDTQYDERAMQMPHVCHFAKSDSSIDHHRCDPAFYTQNAISACNVTGRWAEAKEHVREACERPDWSRGALVSVTESHVYSNVFCALCNEYEFSSVSMCYLPSHGAHSNFGILVRSNTELLKRKFNTFLAVTPPPTLQPCPDGQWPHPRVRGTFILLVLCIHYCSKYGTLPTSSSQMIL